MSKKIDLIIVSGFLGAGKTTFISYMLSEIARRENDSTVGKKTVYVVNEFGQSGLDLNILNRNLETVNNQEKLISYELDNGCICCTLKAEFSQLLGKIIAEHDPDRIIFEPSGLFILSELFNALSGEEYTDKLRISAMICMVDASNDAVNSQTYNQLMANQAQLSDFIIVSKIPTDPEAAAEAISNITLHYPSVEMIAADACDLVPEDWDKILHSRNRTVQNTKRQTMRKLMTDKSIWIRKHAQTEAVLIIPASAGFIKSELEKIMIQIKAGAAGNIIRAKGYLIAEGKSQLLQLVKDEVSLKPLKYKEESRLIFIGQNLNKKKLELLFE